MRQVLFAIVVALLVAAIYGSRKENKKNEIHPTPSLYHTHSQGKLNKHDHQQDNENNKIHPTPTIHHTHSQESKNFEHRHEKGHEKHN
ncbi:uncharacterized protein LOC100204200 isoform X2 [Hydra vulgaris]|uniref:uncharacterized protein LOC100204200 isoform X2 n=1 Tax=Hydra vulgaris TaxID=6087 RepID=UPI001F5FB04B|nr:uncharacterized protein LOC100204200 isoform X3 [Hydra vulgaris]